MLARRRGPTAVPAPRPSGDGLEHAGLVVAGLDPGRDAQPVPGIDRGDREYEPGPLVVVERCPGTIPDVVGDMALGDERYRLSEVEVASAKPKDVVAWYAPTLQRYLTGKLG